MAMAVSASCGLGWLGVWLFGDRFVTNFVTKFVANFVARKFFDDEIGFVSTFFEIFDQETCVLSCSLEFLHQSASPRAEFGCFFGVGLGWGLSLF